MWNPNDFAKYIVKEKRVNVEPQPLAIGTPFYYSFHFLDEYFQALVKLDYPKELLHLYFPVQGKDDTLEMVETFKENYENRYASINIQKRPEIKGGIGPRHISMLNICGQRNWIVEKSKPHDLLFIGHDNFLPPHAIQRMLEGFAYGADIVGGVYCFFRKGLGFTSFFTDENDNHITGLHDQDGKMWFPSCLIGNRAWSHTCGMDCTLIKREVLDQVTFRNVAVKGDHGWSDDVEFCYNAHEKGFKVMTDYSLWIKHWGFSLQFLQPPVNGATQVIASVLEAFLKRRGLLLKHRRVNTNIIPYEKYVQ